MGNKKKLKYTPKYPNGGFVKRFFTGEATGADKKRLGMDALGYVQNTGVGTLDTTLSILGANNAVDDLYSKQKDLDWQKRILNTQSDIYGKMAPAAAQVVGTIYGGPMAGQAASQGVKGLQSIGGSLDKEQNPDMANYSALNQQQLGSVGQFSDMAGNITSMAIGASNQNSGDKGDSSGKPQGMYKMGGKMRYPDGGKVKYTKQTQADIDHNKAFLNMMIDNTNPQMFPYSKPGNPVLHNYYMNYKLYTPGNDSLKYSNSAPYFGKFLQGTGNIVNAQMFTTGGIKYTNGGTGEFNAELEKEEQAITPDGQFTQFNSPSHENGGVKTDLPEGSIIFSDRLKPKGAKETYAQLNKINNTTKEDKTLENINSTQESKKTAELMKKVKQTNSSKLFNDQEAQKQETYRKDFFNNLSAVSYKNGGIYIKPENRGKFTASAKRAGMGVQEYASHILANKKDFSSTLVKRANFAHNAAGWKHPEGGVIVNPTDISSENKYLYNPKGNPNYLNDPNYLAFKNRALDKGLIQTPNNPNLYRGINYTDFGGMNIPLPGSKMKYNPYTNYLPQGQKIQKFEFKNGGMKYSNGGPFEPEGFNYQDPYAYAQYQSNPLLTREFDGSRADLPNGSQIPYADNRTPSFDNSLDKGQESVNPNNNLQRSTPYTNKFQRQPRNWQDPAYYAAGTLAQSAGPLAYLKEQGKRYDTQKFYDYSPERLDPTSALRDADIQAREAAYSLSNASGGNSGNYLSNRIALASGNTLDKARIRSQYQNMNAQIGNQGQQFNIQNRYRTDDINAANKGQALSNYYQSLGQVGTNVASGMKDYRADQYDQERMGYLPYIYNNPEFNQAYGKTRYSRYSRPGFRTK